MNVKRDDNKTQETKCEPKDIDERENAILEQMTIGNRKVLE